MKRLLVALAVLSLAAQAKPKHPKAQDITPLDRYIQEAGQRPAQSAASAGSTWAPAARLGDLASDPHASQVDDLVTILVAESATAVAQGTTKTQRQSSSAASVNALGGLTRAKGPWTNLANTNSNVQLNGQGTTTRQTQITTTLSARVTHVLANGYLVVEGSKEVQINSERQVVTVRGVVRPIDLSADNTVPSNRLAQMEVRVNGKGVIGDAVRRPFFLYRLLLGLLPF